MGYRLKGLGNITVSRVDCGCKKATGCASMLSNSEQEFGLNTNHRAPVVVSLQCKLMDCLID